MKARHQRMIFVGAIGVLMLGAAGFAFRAFKENLTYSYVPTQVVEGDVPLNRQIRLEGLVEEGSVHREPGSLTVHFVVTDLAHSLPAEYTGVLPDLFAEGKGVIAHGRMASDGHFVAETVLAKHDENYIPRDVEEILEENAKKAGT